MFESLLQQAAALKSAQLKSERRWFESLPKSLQNTLFHVRVEEVVEARSVKSAEERFTIAEKLKEKGNECFGENKVIEAIDWYEKCISCFWFVATTEPDFRERGIRDEDLNLERDFVDEDEKVAKLLAIAFVNIAACNLKLKDYMGCEEACSQALEHDSKLVKAWFRRAQARTIPPSAGAVELEQAVDDLKQALKVDPESREVRKLLRELMEQKQKQQDTDRKNLSGMFERGQIYKEKDWNEDERNEKSKIKSLEEEIALYKSMAKSFRARNRTKDAEELEKVIIKAELRLERSQAIGAEEAIDFRNPTEEMIREAKLVHDIDLTDTKVQEEMVLLAEEAKASKQMHSLQNVWLFFFSADSLSVLVVVIVILVYTYKALTY